MRKPMVNLDFGELGIIVEFAGNGRTPDYIGKLVTRTHCFDCDKDIISLLEHRRGDGWELDTNINPAGPPFIVEVIGTFTDIKKGRI